MTFAQRASTASASVPIPAHLVGDLIILVTRNQSNTPPTTPAASGTVPAWNIAQSAGLNGISMVTAWFVAVATTTTTGTWTGATHIALILLRPNTISVPLTVTVSSAGNGAATQTIVYPALTFTNLSGSSWGVRCGTRIVNATAVANPPTGWTNQLVQPTASNAIMAMHTLAGVTSNPVSDSVATAGSNAAYYAHTLEVTEQAPSTQQPMAMII